MKSGALVISAGLAAVKAQQSSCPYPHSVLGLQACYTGVRVQRWHLVLEQQSVSLTAESSLQLLSTVGKCEPACSVACSRKISEGTYAGMLPEHNFTQKCLPGE